MASPLTAERAGPRGDKARPSQSKRLALLKQLFQAVLKDAI